MGMTCGLHRVSSGEIDALIRNPDEMTRVLGLDDGLLDSYEELHALCNAPRMRATAWSSISQSRRS